MRACSAVKCGREASDVHVIGTMLCALALSARRIRARSACLPARTHLLFVFSLQSKDAANASLFTREAAERPRSPDPHMTSPDWRKMWQKHQKGEKDQLVFSVFSHREEICCHRCYNFHLNIQIIFQKDVSGKEPRKSDA